MMAYTILIYLCVAVVCNAAYFFACQGVYPECGHISLIFVNIAILCQLLPALTNNRDSEKIQSNGRHFICLSYLITEIIVATFCLINDVSFATAGTIQILILGSFLIIFFGIARADEKTNQTISNIRRNRSISLLEANASLRTAISECQIPLHKDILRTTYAELNSIPTISNEYLNQIDSDICAKVATLCEKPDIDVQRELSRLINRRKTMLMVINQ